MTARYESILLFGPPGVGKGTQGKIIGAIPGFMHLATGDMFRGLDANSELGRECLSYSTRGLLVPDDLTIRLWTQHVESFVDSGTFDPSRDVLVLDGIPRSLAQAQALVGHIDVLHIVHLACPDIDTMVGRMKKRALEQGRPDDADEAVIRRRFGVYEEETAPVIAHYDPALVGLVDAMGTPAEVLQRILSDVVPVLNERFANPLGA